MSSLLSLARRHIRLIILLSTFGLVGSGVAVAGVVSINYMESADFCGTCHTMAPELHANEQSVHSKVDCGACHVGPGIGGFVEAKINGTRQLFQILTNTYDRPIPPAAHLMLQSTVSANCRNCHANPASRADSLVVRHHFADDEANTEEDIGLLVKIGNASNAAARGIHWHIQSRVEYLASDSETQREVDYIRVTDPSGQVTEFASGDFAPRLAQARSPDGLQTMTCINCHNRAGHELLSPAQAIDNALANRDLDMRLPFIKRQGLALLTATYPSTQAAQQAIGELPNYYRDTYPTLYADQPGRVESATRVLQELYPRVASPEMQASYKDYPNWLGHSDSLGCFRCHDGKHFKLDKDGTPTSATIPSQCATCHTPPQMGDNSSLEALVGTPPATHKARMLFEHAVVIREEGGTSRCTLCHQTPSCGQCHAADVLHERPTLTVTLADVSPSVSNR
jgi:nitrate/TMAO reductase-like tetraheme cytochrome c subunit